MSKATRSILSVVVSLMLFSALTMAQTGRNNADKDKNKEHHKMPTRMRGQPRLRRRRPHSLSVRQRS